MSMNIKPLAEGMILAKAEGRIPTNNCRNPSETCIKSLETLNYPFLKKHAGVLRVITEPNTFLLKLEFRRPFLNDMNEW